MQKTPEVGNAADARGPADSNNQLRTPGVLYFLYLQKNTNIKKRLEFTQLFVIIPI